MYSRGGAFVWPLFQDFAYLDLEPFVVPIDLANALSLENIRVSVPTSVTAAISNTQGIMQNAAVRLLGLTHKEIEDQTQDIILGQMRAVIATMRIEEINQDRQAFLGKVNEAVSGELEKIGLYLINVNIRDIGDESIRIAEGEAEAKLAKMKAEAAGVQAILDGKAKGYEALVAACETANQAASLLLIEKFEDIATVQAQAIQNLPIEKIIVWDGGGKEGGMAGLGGRLTGALPPMHEPAKQVGLDLPEFLGKTEDEQGKKEAAPATE